MIQSWTVTIHYSDGSHTSNKKIYTIENLHKYLLNVDKTKTIIGVLLTPKYEETTNNNINDPSIKSLDHLV